MPILVVAARCSKRLCSGSMEPAFYRGDLLFLTNPASQAYHTGDITVYKVPGADIPIVHRVLETHNAVLKTRGYVSPFHVKLMCVAHKMLCCRLVAASPLAKDQLLLTKGDNNPVDDIDLYQGLEWLERKHIIGKVRG